MRATRPPDPCGSTVPALLGILAVRFRAILMGFVHTAQDYGYYNNVAFVRRDPRPDRRPEQRPRHRLRSRRYDNNIEATVNPAHRAESEDYITPDGTHACVLQFDANMQQLSRAES